MTHPIRLVPLIAVTVLVMPACASTATTPPASSAPAASGELTPAPDGSGTPTLADPGSVLESAMPEAGVPAVWDESSRVAARELAVHAVGAWVNVDDGEDVWRSGLAAWLSPDALAYYAAVDPRNIAAAEITGEPQLVDEDSPELAVVEVPTSAGIYEVTMNRVEAADPWAVQRVRLVS